MVSLALVSVAASGLLVLGSVLATLTGFSGGALPRLGPELLVDAPVLAGLLFGLHRRNRPAALALFVYVLASRVWAWISEPSYVSDSKLIMFDLVVFGATFFGMVGAFKHHRELRQAVDRVA